MALVLSNLKKVEETSCGTNNSSGCTWCIDDASKELFAYLPMFWAGNLCEAGYTI
jgi:hypothetical protein